MASATPTSILPDVMLKRFADRAPGYDRENRFFEEDFTELKQAGYLTAAVPRELGGGGLTFAQMMHEQRRLASHAHATARSVQPFCCQNGRTSESHGFHADGAYGDAFPSHACPAWCCVESGIRSVLNPGAACVRISVARRACHDPPST